MYVLQFNPAMHCVTERLRIMLQTPLTVVEYFYNMIKTIIENNVERRDVWGAPPLLRPDRVPTPHIHATCSGFPSGFVTAFLYSPAPSSIDLHLLVP